MQPELEMNPSDLQLKRVQSLIKTFQMERIVYIILTVISAVSLLCIGLYLAIEKENFQAFLTLLVPTGTLTMCIFRVLKMWDDALGYLKGERQDA